MSEYLNELTGILGRFPREQLRKLAQHLIYSSTVYIAGNGGSAATANHFAVDLMKGAQVRAISLCASPALITALGNDVGFAYVFSEMARYYSMGSNDTLVIISVSGDSPDLVTLAKESRKPKELLRGDDPYPGTIVSLLGRNGRGKLEPLSDTVIAIDSDDYGICEDAHNICCHLIAREAEAIRASQ